MSLSRPTLRRRATIAVASVVVALGAAPAQAGLRVVATLPTLATLVEQVGGPEVEVTALASPTEDPHYVDPRPSLMLALNRADLLVVNGLDLEIGWLPPLQRGARNGAIQTGAPGYFEAASAVAKLDVPTGKVDRAMGDVHPGGNPHFLFDPRACAAVATALGERLASLDGQGAAGYRTRAAALAKSLDAVAQQERERFAALPANVRRVVSYHRSFAYLYDWLSLSEVTTVEPRPGIEPNPGHVAKVLATMREQKLRVIVQEAFYPQSTSATLAKLVGGRVVSLPAGVQRDRGDSLEGHLRGIAESLYHAITAEH